MKDTISLFAQHINLTIGVLLNTVTELYSQLNITKSGYDILFTPD